MQKEFTKPELNERMLFKLRKKGLCVLLTSYNEKQLFTKETIGKAAGESTLVELDKDLLDKDGWTSYDIVAIKQLNSQSEALGYLINDKEPKEWDWIREEQPKKSEKEIQLEELIHKLETQLNDAKSELDKIKND